MSENVGDVMLMEGGDDVKEVLSNLRGYLGDHLPVDVDFLSKLLQYMDSYYNEEMLEEFCVFLEEYSKPARRGLSKIAKRIREDLKP